MLRQELPISGGLPMRPMRIVIEDRELAGATFADCDTSGVDVKICSGPDSERDVCPLVLDGRCPLGRADVVVSSVTGPWQRSVQRAWELEGVPFVHTEREPSATASVRLQQFVAVAASALFEGLVKL